MPLHGALAYTLAIHGLILVWSVVAGISTGQKETVDGLILNLLLEALISLAYEFIASD